MTRARWLIGVVLAVGALIVAGEALASYVSSHLIVGIVAVLVLIGVLVVGLASLAGARLFVARELTALRAQPPGGVLFLARRQQAVELRRRNVAPDLDVLADATAAAEAERAYTGKYLVATTVLIGLVGTFGGLMETLARVAPLLKGELATGGQAGALGLIAGPLAGLHVSFGTSVVAIMVTLALALVQGDVTLHHEQLLALLHERTRHVLIPELWPPEESAAERTVRALQDLRAAVTETLATGLESSATKIAAVVRVEVQRLVNQVSDDLRAANAAQATALAGTSAAMTSSLRETTAEAAKELRQAAATSREAMSGAASTVADTVQKSDARVRAETERVLRAVEAAALAARKESADLMEQASTAVDRAVSGLTEAAARTTESLAVSTAAVVAGLTDTTAHSAASFATSTAAATKGLADAAARTSESFTASSTAALAGLAEATARSAESFTASTTAAVAALAQLRISEAARFDDAARALTGAAGELRGTVETLSPALAQLTPQLGALTTEIALLAARADNPEQPNAILDELMRLGEDVERLVTAGHARVVESETAES